MRVLRIESMHEPMQGVYQGARAEAVDHNHPEGGWYRLPNPMTDCRIPYFGMEGMVCGVASVEQFKLWWPTEVIQAMATVEARLGLGTHLVVLECDDRHAKHGNYQTVVRRARCEVLHSFSMQEAATLSDDDLALLLEGLPC